MPRKRDRFGRFVTFSTIGVLNVTQELAGIILADIEDAEPDLVAEETLCLVATSTARAAEVSLDEEPEAASESSNLLLDLPFLYRDYLLGGEMLERQDSSLLEQADDVYARLQRKRSFYTAHLPAGRFPGEHALTEKMGLWMGRVSPPRLPEMPTDRLERLQLVRPLLIHLKLVLAYGREGGRTSSNGAT